MNQRNGCEGKGEGIQEVRGIRLWLRYYLLLERGRTESRRDTQREREIQRERHGKRDKEIEREKQNKTETHKQRKT